MQPINPFANNTDYWVDPERGEEMTRLIDLNRVVTEQMGGVFPPGYILPPGSIVLDLAGGPGEWACTVAKAYPESDVICLDISQKMIRYGRAQAQAQHLRNVTFEEGDILQALKYPDDSLDFVNVRLISSFMRVQAWPSFLHECMRILRPGGTLRLTEGEWSLTTSPANEKFAELVACAMLREEKSWGTERKFIGACIHLGSFLQSLHLTNIRHASYFVDFGYGTPYYEIMTQSTVALYPRMSQFLLRNLVASQPEIDALCQKLSDEFLEPSFRGGGFFRSVWGNKPL